jgi:hypothetical protein
MHKTTIILLLLLVAGIGIAWDVRHAGRQPSSGRLNVSIKFLGYTNDSSGNPMAMIGVTNLGTCAIYAYQPLVEIPDPASPSGLNLDPSHRPLSWQSTLGHDAAAGFTIALPTNQSPWRVTLEVYNDLGLAQTLMRKLKLTARSMPCQIQSEWVGTNQPPDTTLKPTPASFE